MKKLLLILILFGLSMNVYADDYSVKQLIPVDSYATVNTELFSYQNMIFSSATDEKGNGLIRFSAIQNFSSKKVPVSINLLLFDENQKNIGYVTYCSLKDFDSDYAKFQLNATTAHEFAIIVNTKYYVDDKGVADTKYVAVYDDNPYCHIGGYDKYKGLTLDEIVNNVEKENKSMMDQIVDYVQHFMKSSMGKIFIYVIGGLVILSIIGSIINKLYLKMYQKNTNLAYLPFINFYICMSITFGKLFGYIYLGIVVAGAILIFLNIPYVMYVALGLGFLSLLVVILKLITKKYDMYFEPSKVNNHFNDSSTDSFFHLDETKESNKRVSPKNIDNHQVDLSSMYSNTQPTRDDYESNNNISEGISEKLLTTPEVSNKPLDINQLYQSTNDESLNTQESSITTSSDSNTLNTIQQMYSQNTTNNVLQEENKQISSNGSLSELDLNYTHSFDNDNGIDLSLDDYDDDDDSNYE